MEQMPTSEISRYDAAKAPPLDAEEHDLRPIVTASWKAARNSRSGRAPQIIAAPSRAAAEIDERRIERVIRNLVVNATNTPMDRRVTITVATRMWPRARPGRRHDPGVSPTVLDRFYRADTASTHARPAARLGLATRPRTWRTTAAAPGGEPGKGASFLRRRSNTPATDRHMAPTLR